MLVWQETIQLETEPGIVAMEEALARDGTLEIFNPDQGLQDTREAFTAVLLARSNNQHGWGKGRWVDTVGGERLWRVEKDEEVNLGAYGTQAALQAGLTHDFQFSHIERRHQALNRQTPDAVYVLDPTVKQAA